MATKRKPHRQPTEPTDAAAEYRPARASVSVGKDDVIEQALSRLERTLESMGIDLDEVHELEWQGSKLKVKRYGGPTETGEAVED